MPRAIRSPLRDLAGVAVAACLALGSLQPDLQATGAPLAAAASGSEPRHAATDLHQAAMTEEEPAEPFTIPQVEFTWLENETREVVEGGRPITIETPDGNLTLRLSEYPFFLPGQDLVVYRDEDGAIDRTEPFDGTFYRGHAENHTGSSARILMSSTGMYGLVFVENATYSLQPLYHDPDNATVPSIVLDNATGLPIQAVTKYETMGADPPGCGVGLGFLDAAALLPSPCNPCNGPPSNCAPCGGDPTECAPPGCRPILDPGCLEPCRNVFWNECCNPLEEPCRLPCLLGRPSPGCPPPTCFPFVPCEPPNCGACLPEVDPRGLPVVQLPEQSHTLVVKPFADKKFQSYSDWTQRIASALSAGAGMWEKETGIVLRSAAPIPLTKNFVQSTSCDGMNDSGLYDFKLYAEGWMDPAHNAYALFQAAIDPGPGVAGCGRIRHLMSAINIDYNATSALTMKDWHKVGCCGWGDTYDPDETHDRALAIHHELTHNAGERDHPSAKKCKWYGKCTYNLMTKEGSYWNRGLWRTEATRDDVKEYAWPILPPG